MQRLNCFAVDRVDFAKGINDTAKLTEILKSGDSIFIFPEGTFSYAAGLRPFRMGAFKMAVDANVPVCPMAFQGVRYVLREGSRLLNPGAMTVTVCDLVYPEGTEWQGVVMMRDAVRKEIAEYCGEESFGFYCGRDSCNEGAANIRKCMPQFNKVVLAWCLYDWAVASFSVIVTTFVFATYFTGSVASDTIVGTYQWANAASLAGIIIAISSPVFGAIADHGGKHRRWLVVFTLLSALSSALLWFAYPDTHSVYWMLSWVVVGTVGFELAAVFYNAYLPHIVSKDYIGRVSGIGWGLGYFGGIVALTVVLAVFLNPHFTWLDKKTLADVRIAGPFVAVWMVVFSAPLFFLAPSITTHSLPFGKATVVGISELKITLKKLIEEKNMLLYLVAHMIYTDGLNTLFAFGGIYAAGTYGMTFKEVLLFGITMNVSAGTGAVLLGWLDDRLGSKTSVLLSLVCLTIFGIPILLLHDKYIFWAVALLLCLFVGPVQAASRSLLVHLIDKKLSAEMFGLYALSGRITAFIGPWLLGVMTIAFHSQRAGMATILCFFAIGALLLLKVKVQSSGSTCIYR